MSPQSDMKLLPPHQNDAKNRGIRGYLTSALLFILSRSKIHLHRDKANVKAKIFLDLCCHFV